MPAERAVQPAARPHTAWSRTREARECLLGCAILAAAAWGWSAWRSAERAACASALAGGTVETVDEAGPWTYRVSLEGGPAVRLEVAPGGLVPRPGCRGRVCLNGHWHAGPVETARRGRRARPRRTRSRWPWRPPTFPVPPLDKEPIT